MSLSYLIKNKSLSRVILNRTHNLFNYVCSALVYMTNLNLSLPKPTTDSRLFFQFTSTRIRVALLFHSNLNDFPTGSLEFQARLGMKE
jgi:hypothetical protein